MKLGPRQQAWVDTLRSGEYKQGKYNLCHQGRYCCLGVACDLAHKSGVGQRVGDNFIEQTKVATVLTTEVAVWLKMKDRSGFIADLPTSLVELNDNGVKFDDIANFIESHADELFKEPA